jgi:hypothetical protein
MHVEMENVSQLSSTWKRSLIYTSVAAIGITVLVKAQLEVSLQRTPDYDLSEVTAGFLLSAGGIVPLIGEKVYGCYIKQKLLPI